MGDFDCVFRVRAQQGDLHTWVAAVLLFERAVRFKGPPGVAGGEGVCVGMIRGVTSGAVRSSSRSGVRLTAS